MGAIATLTLADGATTPVNHTFSPQPDVMSNQARWVDRVGGIALGYPMVTMTMRNPNKATRNYKVTVRVVTPVLEVTSPSTASGIQPAPTLAYNLVADMNFVLPERSTLSQRKDMFAYAKNLLANTVLTNAIHDFEPVY